MSKSRHKIGFTSVDNIPIFGKQCGLRYSVLVNEVIKRDYKTKRLVEKFPFI
jgi:hypothetical protein